MSASTWILSVPSPWRYRPWGSWADTPPNPALTRTRRHARYSARVVSAILTAGFLVSVRLWVVSHRSTSVTAHLSIGEGWRSAAITFAEAKPLLAYYIEPVILDMQSNAARHSADILTSLDRKRNLFFEA